MKYFTPELYAQFNSSDPAKASLADQRWDAAEVRYEKRLKEIRRKLPEKVRVLSDTICLHDASYLGFTKSPLPPWRWELAIIQLQQAEKLYFLVYILPEEPVITKPVESPVFADEQPRWLYDEVDLLEKGTYSHQILISNGYVLNLVFQQFDFFEIDTASPRNGKKSRKTLVTQT